MGLRGVLILGWAGTFGSISNLSTYAFILSQTVFAVGEGGFRKHTTPTHHPGGVGADGITPQRVIVTARG
jgi:hypothetical protein